jgi:hypothetical protein
MSKIDIKDYYPTYSGIATGVVLYLIIRFGILKYEPVWWIKSLIFIFGYVLFHLVWNYFINKNKR